MKEISGHFDPDLVSTGLVSLEDQKRLLCLAVDLRRELTTSQTHAKVEVFLQRPRAFSGESPAVPMLSCLRVNLFGVPGWRSLSKDGVFRPDSCYKFTRLGDVVIIEGTWQHYEPDRDLVHEVEICGYLTWNYWVGALQRLGQENECILKIAAEIESHRHQQLVA